LLNKHQQAAVDSPSKRLLVLAGAGTGKTYTMIERIKRLIADGVEPSSILVLTFTNAAAFEMGQRFQTDSDEARPTFQTFHGFCYHLMIKSPQVRGALGYKQVPNIITPERTKELDARTRASHHIKASATSLNKDAGTGKDAFEHAVYWKVMKNQMRVDNLISFDHLCKGVCGLFSNNSPVVKEYLEKYKYIFVDEFQDTDKVQWDFVQSFKDSSIFLVGDVQQAIYEFRGADSTIIQAVAEDPEWETLRIVDNYRSTSNICQFANDIVFANETTRLKLVSDRVGTEPITESQDTPWALEDNRGLRSVVASAISDLEHGTVAILLCTNMEVNFVAESVRYALPGNYIDKSRTINLLAAVLDGKFRARWLASLLPRDTYVKYLKQEALKTGDLESVFERSYQTKELVNTLRKIQDILSSPGFALPKSIAIAEFLGIQNPEFGHIEETVEGIIRAVTQIVESERSPVYVGTIHSVKGLEFDSVYLLGAGSKVFSLKTEAQKNLFYVGVTRAKEKLFVGMEDRD